MADDADQYQGASQAERKRLLRRTGHFLQSLHGDIPGEHQRGYDVDFIASQLVGTLSTFGYASAPLANDEVVITDGQSIDVNDTSGTVSVSGGSASASLPGTTAAVSDGDSVTIDGTTYTFTVADGAVTGVSSS